MQKRRLCRPGKPLLSCGVSAGQVWWVPMGRLGSQGLSFLRVAVSLGEVPHELPHAWQAKGSTSRLVIQRLRARGGLRALFCLAEVESPSRLQILPFGISMVTGSSFWWLRCPQRHQNKEAGASSVPWCGGFASQSWWPHSLVPVEGSWTCCFPSARGGQVILAPVGKAPTGGRVLFRRAVPGLPLHHCAWHCGGRLQHPVLTKSLSGPSAFITRPGKY